MEKRPVKKVLKAYEAPEIVELGSLHGLTLQLKTGKLCDVSCLHHGSLSLP